MSEEQVLGITMRGAMSAVAMVHSLSDFACDHGWDGSADLLIWVEAQIGCTDRLPPDGAKRLSSREADDIVEKLRAALQEKVQVHDISLIDHSIDGVFRVKLDLDTRELMNRTKDVRAPSDRAAPMSKEALGQRNALMRTMAMILMDMLQPDGGLSEGEKDTYLGQLKKNLNALWPL